MRLVATASLALALLAFGMTARAQGTASDPELEAGIRSVDEGNFEQGIAQLDKVARRLKAAGDKPIQLSRAYLYLGIAHLQLSQEQVARARFAEAVKVDQNLKLSNYEFAPPVIKMFEEAKKELDRLQAQSPGTGKTTAPPPAAGTATTPPPAAPPSPAARAAFFEAVKAGDFAGTRQQLSQTPALATASDPEFGATALHWAALRGQAAVAGLLVASGADLNARNKAGETPEQVARRAKHPEVAAILVPGPPAGAAPAGATIFDAAKTGDTARLQELLRSTPSLVSVRDTAFGATPLHWAALRGHIDAARQLVQAGADVGALNNDGETPLDVARRAKREDVERLLESATSTPKARLFQAARAGDKDVVAKLLSENPALVREKDATFAATALHWAALRGRTGVVQVLLANGADKKARNSAGETPYDVATRADHDDVARLLAP
jgi:ankyrin repeat protein